jgi:Secretion system C-terminal sorting domain
LIFDQGLWVTGKRNGAYGWVPYIWNSSFSPGPIINGQPALKAKPGDSLRYRVYMAAVGETPDTNPDVGKWPADLGAPVDSSGQPRILGDQTAWTLFNGADTTLTPNFFWNRKLSPRALLPVEVHETAFEHFGEFADTTVWANSVFFEWSIYNKGLDPLDSVYLTMWTDLDFVDAYYDFPAVDTASQTAYCWYGKDSTFASTGYTLLFGPSIQSQNDTAVFFGKKRAGYRNLPLGSFWAIEDDSYPDSSLYGPPYSLGTAWNVVRGFMQNGNPMIDSTTHQPTKFPYSGDPITHTGSLWPLPYTGGGAGFAMTIGPFSMAAGDSQWIMIAVLPSEKKNGVDAINRMRTNARYLRSLPYDSLITRKPRRNFPIKPLPNFASPALFKLYSSYPNPFNSETTIEFDLPEVSIVRVDIYDALGRLTASLGDQLLGRGTQIVRWSPTVSSGVYFVRLKAASTESALTWSGVNKILLLR